jgi:(1->4)-alpha-D-glucan 1-alpha-D-glucosylmutase
MGATYRLQLRPGDLDWATQVVAHVARLGADTLYLSPITGAVPGSSHGYDVADPTGIDPALGGSDAFARLLQRADEHDVGLLLDIVPNHLAASEHNPWWADVLRHGQTSAYGAVFDIDWSAHGGRVLVPVLGQPFGAAVDAGEVTVAVAARTGEPAGIVAGEPVVVVGDRRLPLAPASWRDLAAEPADLVRSVAGRPGRPRSWDGLQQLLARQHYRLAYWRTANEEVNYRRFFDIDGLVGVRAEDPDVFAATHRLVMDLAAHHEVVGVRVDHVDGLADPAAYLARLRQQLAGDGSARSTRSAGVPVVLVEKILARGESLPPWPVQGTTGYELADLAVGLLVDAGGAGLLAERATDAGSAAQEQAGDFASLAAAGRRVAVTTLFPRQLDDLTAMLTTVARRRRSGHDVTAGQLRHVLVELAAAMPTYRTYVVGRPSRADRAVLGTAAQQVQAALGPAGTSPPKCGPGPSAALSSSASAKWSARPSTGDTPEDLRLALDELTALLLGGFDRSTDPTAVDQPDAQLAALWRLAVRRWQQLCTAVAAKGVEDTACYRFGGSLAQVDVGGTPDEPAVGTGQFHDAMALRQRSTPQALNTLSTHDSKRSADARCRLAALTETASSFEKLMDRWCRRHDPLVLFTEHGRSPDELEQRFLYQTMAAIWPLEPLAPTSRRSARRADLLERLQRYAEKAAREAKRRTSWTAPGAEHERAVARFIRRLLITEAGDRFLAEMDRLVAGIGPATVTNSLALVVLQTMAPGVPDIYQGCEGWVFTVVDPDNRGPLDVDAASKALDHLTAVAGARLEPRALLEEWASGTVKRLVTSTTLHLRRRHRGLFRSGTYLPLAATGPAASHIVAFARRWRGRWVLAVVPRLVVGLVGTGRFPVGSGVWSDTAVVLPPDAPMAWHLELTGAARRTSHGRLLVASLLDELPVAVASGHER